MTCVIKKKRYMPPDLLVHCTRFTFSLLVKFQAISSGLY